MKRSTEEFLNHLVHVSEKPWSDYTASDYSLEQWHNACLIHQHTGSVPTSKDQCKLPVKTPSGALNRNGVHAAAAALAGARSPMNITTAQKGEAARKIASLYTQLGEKPSPNLIKMKALHSDMGKEFIEHVGVKGMHWGIRKARRDSSGRLSVDARKSMTTKTKAKESGVGVKALTNNELQKYNKRLELEKNFARLNTEKNVVDKGHDKVKEILAIGATLNAIALFASSPVGRAIARNLIRKPAGAHFAA